MAENMDEMSYSGGRRSFKQRFSKRVLLFLAFFAIILILLLGVAYFATRGSTSSKEQKPTPAPTEEVTPTPTPTPTEEPTPTPKPKSTPTPTKASSSTQTGIVVQNGSGVAGAAASAAAVLKEAGYSVSTGNADNFDYTGVTIKVKSNKSDLAAALKNILSKDYSISATSSDLSEGQSYDALVIIGK